MQVVVNCVIHDKERQQILMLQKPRRGWWVAPGGKVELGESLAETAVREVVEETGLVIESPALRGAFTIHLREADELVGHWMLFTFYVDAYEGTALTASEEGLLEWVDVAEVLSRPMAAGDVYIFEGVLAGAELVTGCFVYTPEYELIEWRPE